MVASPVSLVAKFVNCSKLKRINYPCNEEGDEEGRGGKASAQMKPNTLGTRFS